MNETGTAARAWMNPTEAEQRAETQILRPSFRLISGLENTPMLWPTCISLHVAGRHRKSSERLRVKHVRFEGGPIRLKLIPPLLADFTKRTWSLNVKSYSICQPGLGVPI
jgi:hypothetical protein